MTSDAEIIDRIDSTIRELKDRIKNHRDHIKAHETRTRVVLIDPLLRSRGWDPEDPRLVQHEYKVNQGWADYALMKGGSVVAIIEAKKLDRKFADGALVEKVAAFPGIELVVFTNGNEWQFFRAPKFASKLVKVDSDIEFKTAFEFHSELPDPELPNGPPPPPPPRKCYPLVGKFPDGTPTSVQKGEAAPTQWVSWRQLYVDVAKYLVSSGDIRPSDLPIWVTKGQKWAINHEPIGPDGNRFISPAQIGESMWLEANGNRITHTEYSRRLLRNHHDDPESVQVCFD